MAVRPLPEHPDLEQLKRQAKELLQAARAGDAPARSRFASLPAFASLAPSELAARRFALHDAQSVIAREHGLASWNDLRDHVEERTLAFAGAVTSLIEAAGNGRSERAERLLALHPTIPQRDVLAAIVLGDHAEVDRRLRTQPELATRELPPRGWQPLHALCHSSLIASSPARETGAIAIARRLLALGADPNLRYPWRHHGVFRPVLWAAVCVARSRPLARVLLEAGAEPNDGVTLSLAASGGDLAALELLREFGADVDHPWASDGSRPLFAILQWGGTPSGAHWLLEHGADPDPVFAATGETPLHVVAGGWDVAMAEALVSRGAAIDRPRGDGRTPYTLAAMNGNTALARWLVEHGAADALTPVDRVIARCSAGDREGALALLRDDPDLRRAVGTGYLAPLLAAAERDDVAVIETLLACGFDPNLPDDSIGKTALHVAAAEGRPAAVRCLLDHGADVTARDREFHGTPLVWAADGLRSRPPGRDHAAVAELLLAAGSPTQWQGSDEPSDVIHETIAAWCGIDLP